MRRIAASRLLAPLFAVAAPSALAAEGPKKDNDTHVQLLAFNDFHGHLEPNTPGTIQVGCCDPVLTGTPPVRRGGGPRPFPRAASSTSRRI